MRNVLNGLMNFLCLFSCNKNIKSLIFETYTTMTIVSRPIFTIKLKSTGAIWQYTVEIV